MTGTWTANADGTYSDNTTTTGDEQFTLGPSCLVISSTPVTCDGAASIIKNLGYSSLDLHSHDGRWLRVLGHRPTDRQPGAGFRGADEERQLHDGGKPGHDHGRRGRHDGLVLRLGKPADPDPAEREPDHDGDDRAPEQRHDRHRRHDRYRGHDRHCGRGWRRGRFRLRGHERRPRRLGRWDGAGRKCRYGGRGGAGGTTGAGGAVGGRGGGSGTGGTAGSAGTSGTAGTSGSPGPCDIYKSGGNPCVAAHSTVRALFAAYSGKLYQVRNSAGATKDILTLTAGGFADGPSQDTFCSGTTCVITVVYDQSGKGNDLWYQGSTMVPGSTSSTPSKATSESLTLSGHKVYSLYINPNNSYWVDASASGIPLGSQPEGMYMVTSGKHYNSGCCFDYGNSETDRKADGSGAMDAINFSSITAWGTGAGSGPWVMADLEYGVFAQNSTDQESERSHPDQHVCHRRTEEQRDDGIRAQGQRRDVRQPGHVLQGRPTGRMEPDEEAGRDRPRKRR